MTPKSGEMSPESAMGGAGHHRRWRNRSAMLSLFLSVACDVAISLGGDERQLSYKIRL